MFGLVLEARAEGIGVDRPDRRAGRPTIPEHRHAWPRGPPRESAHSSTMTPTQFRSRTRHSRPSSPNSSQSNRSVGPQDYVERPERLARLTSQRCCATHTWLRQPTTRSNCSPQRQGSHRSNPSPTTLTQTTDRPPCGDPSLTHVARYGSGLVRAARDRLEARGVPDNRGRLRCPALVQRGQTHLDRSARAKADGDGRPREQSRSRSSTSASVMTYRSAYRQSGLSPVR